MAHLVSGKSEDFKDKILSNVSKTRRQMILSDIASGRQFFRNDVEHITSSFFATLRRAWERGELRIEGRDDGEVYV